MTSSRTQDLGDTVSALRATAPSLATDSRSWETLNAALSRRFPFGASGIDWALVEPLTEGLLKSRALATEFADEAIDALGLDPHDRVILVGDHVLETIVTLAASDLGTAVAHLIELPLGFICGPSDGSWDWVIDIRFARAAWAARSPEVIR